MKLLSIYHCSSIPQKYDFGDGFEKTLHFEVWDEDYDHLVFAADLHGQPVSFRLPRHLGTAVMSEKNKPKSRPYFQSRKFLGTAINSIYIPLFVRYAYNIDAGHGEIEEQEDQIQVGTVYINITNSKDDPYVRFYPCVKFELEGDVVKFKDLAVPAEIITNLF